ncbi:hypothetical protein TNCV_1138511 [Trichonephila clavipes]|nr:hypothetical protein TNCV_1138511 [Trichonephila clavipes]
MESTKILVNGKRLPTPILFGLNFPAVVQIQLTELNANLMDGKIDKREAPLTSIIWDGGPATDSDSGAPVAWGHRIIDMAIVTPLVLPLGLTKADNEGSWEIEVLSFPITHVLEIFQQDDTRPLVALNVLAFSMHKRFHFVITPRANTDVTIRKSTFTEVDLAALFELY